jgi:hypothetical protein
MKEIRYETLRYTASSKLLLGTLGAEHNRELRENRNLTAREDICAIARILTIYLSLTIARASRPHPRVAESNFRRIQLH